MNKANVNQRYIAHMKTGPRFTIAISIHEDISNIADVPVLFTDPILYKAAVDGEFGRLAFSMRVNDTIDIMAVDQANATVGCLSGQPLLHVW